LLAQLDRNIAVARYEFAIQTAFREVSDALGARDTYDDELAARKLLLLPIPKPMNLHSCASARDWTAI
jgi:hypothetical protein